MSANFARKTEHPINYYSLLADNYTQKYAPTYATKFTNVDLMKDVKINKNI